MKHTLAALQRPLWVTAESTTMAEMCDGCQAQGQGPGHGQTLDIFKSFKKAACCAIRDMIRQL
jgi:hypothetical protein